MAAPLTTEEIISGVVVAIILVGFVYLFVKVRRWIKSDRDAWATELGELVQVTAGNGCSLCGSDLGGGYRGGGQAHRVAELDLCERCYAADFGDRLDEHGLRIQDVKILGYPREGSTGGTNRDIRGAVPYDLGLTASFSRQRDASKLSKGFNEELKTGDPEFDEAVFVSTTTADRLRQALQDRGLRQAIAASVNYSGFGFTLDEHGICFNAFHMSAAERVTLRCCAAVILAHLERLARQEGLEERPGLARYPDLTTLYAAGDSTVRRLFITHSLLDGLTDVATLYAGQASGSKPLTGLWLEDVHLRSRSLEPLAELELLTFLRIADVPLVRDLTPLAGLIQLEELTINRCPIRDAAPLAKMTQLRELSLADTGVADVSALTGLTALTMLDLRRTQVSDLSHLASLTQLEVLRTAGSPVDEGTARALRRALPQLQLDPY
ncbi:MAG: hypothetical protein DRI90_09775 [Deltaproteobacteria bacterium]|nr:MAG: hypothetical protein DRI90_09775 [Deltaproteobacteria bacterium]